MYSLGSVGAYGPPSGIISGAGVEVTGLASVPAATTPIPIGRLNLKVFDQYLPDIMSEVHREFILQDDERTRRNTREYGYSFFQLEGKDRTYGDPPPFLQALGREICQAFGHPPQVFTNVILSLYGAGFHLEPHIDTNSKDPHDKGYYFEENVYGLIVKADTTGHLYFVCDDVNLRPALDLEPIYSLVEQPGTIFCLQGDYRRAPFFHAVSQVSEQRISLTFRRVVFEEKS